MTDYFKGLYIGQLTEQRQQALENVLRNAGLAPDEIEIAMCSRVSDLMDTINLTNVLGL